MPLEYISKLQNSSITPILIAAFNQPKSRPIVNLSIQIRKQILGLCLHSRLTFTSCTCIIYQINESGYIWILNCGNINQYYTRKPGRGLWYCSNSSQVTLETLSYLRDRQKQSLR